MHRWEKVAHKSYFSESCRWMQGSKYLMWEILPEQPAQGFLPVKQSRSQPLACRGLLEPRERVRKMPHQREWYRRELVFFKVFVS